MITLTPKLEFIITYILSQLLLKVELDCMTRYINKNVLDGVY